MSLWVPALALRPRFSSKTRLPSLPRPIRTQRNISIPDILHSTASAFAFTLPVRPFRNISSNHVGSVPFCHLRQSPVATLPAVRGESEPTMAGPHNILPPIGNVTSMSSNNGMAPGTSPVTSQQHSNADITIMGRPQLPQAPQLEEDLPRRPPPPPLDTMRAYRACLNCRNRKSKCDLDINGGRPVSVAACLPVFFLRIGALILPMAFGKGVINT